MEPTADVSEQISACFNFHKEENGVLEVIFVFYKF